MMVPLSGVNPPIRGPLASIKRYTTYPANSEQKRPYRRSCTGDGPLRDYPRSVSIEPMVFAATADPPLLERDAELGRLDAMLAKASAGTGAVLKVSGPAGIGKSELLAEGRRRAGQQGLRSLNACGRELETG